MSKKPIWGKGDDLATPEPEQPVKRNPTCGQCKDWEPSPKEAGDKRGICGRPFPGKYGLMYPMTVACSGFALEEEDLS